MTVAPTPASPDAPNVPPSNQETRLWAVIPCAGTGSRALDGQSVQGPKQYQLVGDLPMVMHTLAAFRGVQRLAGTLVVVSPGDEFWQSRDDAPMVEPCGGATRAKSVTNGLKALRQRGALDGD